MEPTRVGWSQSLESQLLEQENECHMGHVPGNSWWVGQHKVHHDNAAKQAERDVCWAPWEKYLFEPDIGELETQLKEASHQLHVLQNNPDGG